MKNKYYIILLIFLSTAQLSFSQKIVRSTFSSIGYSYSNQNVGLKQTAGQSSNTNVSLNNDLILRQGFQQPVFSSEIKKTENAMLNYSIYPNPNNGTFTLNVELQEPGFFTYEMYNILGSKVHSDEVYSNKNNIISTNTLSSGIYLLRVKTDGYSLGEIKIIVY